MSMLPSPKASRGRQSRKSIAYMPMGSDHGGDKENATMDLASLSSAPSRVKQGNRKTRSKSIEPGGLAALKESSGNKGEITLPQVRSILKPTVKLSPPKTIPPRNNLPTGSPDRSGEQHSRERYPKLSPKKRTSERSPSRAGRTSPSKHQSPSRSPSRVALRTEEEQHAAAREKERQEILAHKDERRKSLAKRRVSFAPEATLHTWNVVEMPEDSTTSSASTNSTRRASGISTDDTAPYIPPRSPMPSSDASEPPSTPPERIEETQVTASPAHQRDLHQKKRRRSSGIPPMNFNDPNDFSSSPASAQSDDTATTAFETVDEGTDSSDSGDEDLVEDETMVGNVDGDESTMHSVGDNSTSSSGKLEAALQQAAHQAGTQGIDFDEHGDLTMEMADDEITSSFQPFIKQGKYTPQIVDAPGALEGQEKSNPFSPAFKASTDPSGHRDEGPMDMTQALGGIIAKSDDPQASPKLGRRKSAIATNRRSSAARRRSSGADSGVPDDETMDLKTAIGGIQTDQDNDHGSAKDDEELTMEFTSAFGEVVQSGESHSDRLVDDGGEDSIIHEEAMDFTVAGGGILPTIAETTEPIDDQTMDVTTAIGAILPPQLSANSKADAKTLMELETNAGQLSAFSLPDDSPQRPMGAGLHDERPLPAQVHRAAMASDTGSPSFIDRAWRSGRHSMTPEAKSKQPTPKKQLGTPAKQLTPKLIRPETPGKTPPSKNVSMRTGSPKKLFKAEIKAQKDEESTPTTALHNPLFQNDPLTGAATPSIILKPHRRRSSGLGIDREGLGSPRVTELLDRRQSIGDNAKPFVTQGVSSNGVRFEDPQVMGRDLDHERAEDERRQSGRDILETEADRADASDDGNTANLKDMIDRMTPQRKKLNGRKSLHVGAAKGLLGKRPAELDDDEDESSMRLAGREGSPVKKIRLAAPPPSSATVVRGPRRSKTGFGIAKGDGQAITPSTTASPSEQNTTPKDQSRFKDPVSGEPANVRSFAAKVDGLEVDDEPTERDSRMHLQDFLNMTSIRFMELTTTKRRHTIAPNVMTDGDEIQSNATRGDSKPDLESCVTAGTCTVPMLELYQHSCRELKSYISEGRSIVKEIEADTYDDNPPLFNEYMSAPPDVKTIMDNQFKNVKTHARLLSKAMWYEWRMKLLDGLKEGLVKIGDDMADDDRSLTQQEQMIQPVLPGLIEKHDHLESQVQIAQEQADELASCDQDELKSVRDSLMSIEEDLHSKEKLLGKLQEESRQHQDRLEVLRARKQVSTDELKGAEKTLQDCRGWSAKEVAVLQDKVNALEASHGWIVTNAGGPALTMTFERTLQLFFAPNAFLSRSTQANAAFEENAPISLTYVADENEYHPNPLTTEKRFFLQIMRAQLQCLQQRQTHVKDLLDFVAASWRAARTVCDRVKVMGINCITDSTIISDEAMTVRSSILLRSMRTKVETAFDISVQSSEGVQPLDMSIKASARVIYGEALKEKKMGEFLESKIKGVEGRGVWADAVRELEERCLARGKK